MDEKWVTYGAGRNDKFPNPRTGGDFIINSTELRAVNFSLEVVGTPPVRPRSGGRRAAVVSAPLPKKYKMPNEIDHEIRKECGEKISFYLSQSPPQQTESQAVHAPFRWYRRVEVQSDYWCTRRAPCGS